MPKLGMAPFRKEQLIKASISCIHKYGLKETTMTKVGQQAGISPSIIAHYFGNKDALMLATMRFILQSHKESVLQRLKSANTPKEKITAIIDANFNNAQMEPEIVSTWLSFWAKSKHNINFSRLQNINNRRLRSNLLSAIQQLQTDKKKAIIIAEGIAALIDGLWLRSVLEENTDTEKSKKIINSFLESQLNNN